MKPKLKGIPKPIDRLYKAVDNYVKKNGGNIIVIGGIQTMVLPEDNKYQFTIAVKCLGKKPTT